jgi:GH24 family phage-related lysozyme (muramidase)
LSAPGLEQTPESLEKEGDSQEDGAKSGADGALEAWVRACPVPLTDEQRAAILAISRNAGEGHHPTR